MMTSRGDTNLRRPEKQGVIVGRTCEAETTVPLPRRIIGGLDRAALFAAFVPAWAATVHLASAAWRPDLCDGGGQRAAHAEPHDSCPGSAGPLLRAAERVLRRGGPALAPQRVGATTDALHPPSRAL